MKRYRDNGSSQPRRLDTVDDDEPLEITRDIILPPPEGFGPARGARLTILDGDDQGRRFTLAEHAAIGRDAGLAIQLRDPLVSRLHARVLRVSASTYELEDLGSRNGTHLNGKPISRSPLCYGDRIVVGTTTLLFACRDEAEDRLIEREQLETLGRLGAGLVHDMNNLLAISLSAAGLLRELLLDRQQLLSATDEALEDVEAIIKASERGRDLTEQLLRLARRQPIETEELNLTSLVRETVELARRVFHQGIELDCEIDDDIRVVGNRAELHRVLMNLLLNARDAMPRGGCLGVRLVADGEEADTSSNARESEARLSVRDSGAGMDEATRSRIFERLFTTKGPARGSGLGLHAVAQVVAGHGGRIYCDSAPGRGTFMEIVLPRAGIGARSRSQTRLRPPSLLEASRPRTRR